MEPSHHIFDRRAKRLQRTRAAQQLAQSDFLLREVAERMAERLEEVQQNSFPVAVELGCRTGYLKPLATAKASILHFIGAELAPGYRADLLLDEEWLPFAEESVHLFLSLLNFHWVNDLPGALVQLKRALAPAGLMVATLFGGQTLKELRQAIAHAAQGGMRPHISPFVEVKDAGALLQRAGFHLPVADSEIITVRYKNAWDLMTDLHHLGEGNALAKRTRALMSKGALDAIAKAYAELFSEADGRMPATFEIITLTGWKS
jgi:SAM-dependent methyltransferase